MAVKLGWTLLTMCLSIDSFESFKAHCWVQAGGGCMNSGMDDHKAKKLKNKKQQQKMVVKMERIIFLTLCSCWFIASMRIQPVCLGIHSGGDGHVANY